MKETLTANDVKAEEQRGAEGVNTENELNGGLRSRGSLK